jgi:UDP-N-acetylglucosamine acyltransferase
MSSLIHPSAIIDPSAQLAEDVRVGPFAIIGPNCQIGASSEIAAHAVLEKNVMLGERVNVGHHAVLGGDPQDFGYKGERSFVTVGDDTRIREFVTLHRATGEDQTTAVGSNCLIMAYSHAGHNTRIGNGVILANCVQLAGHVVVGDKAVIGGIFTAHQHVRIGEMVIISGFSATRMDIPPFIKAAGCPTLLHGLNLVGLKRNDVSIATRTALKQAYKHLWLSGLPLRQAIEEVSERFSDDPYVMSLITFLRESKRGVVQPEHRVKHVHALSSLEAPVLA